VLGIGSGCTTFSGIVDAGVGPGLVDIVAAFSGPEFEGIVIARVGAVFKGIVEAGFGAVSEGVVDAGFGAVVKGIVEARVGAVFRGIVEAGVGPITLISGFVLGFTADVAVTFDDRPPPPTDLLTLTVGFVRRTACWVYITFFSRSSISYASREEYFPMITQA